MSEWMLLYSSSGSDIRWQFEELARRANFRELSMLKDEIDKNIHHIQQSRFKFDQGEGKKQ